MLSNYHRDNTIPLNKITKVTTNPRLAIQIFCIYSNIWWLDSLFLFLIKPTLDSTWRTLFGCVLQIWGWKHNTNRLSWFVRLRFLCLFGGYLRTKIRYLREDIFSPKVPTAHLFHRHLSRQRLISDSAATTTATFLMQTNWNGHFPHASVCICARIRYHNCCLLCLLAWVFI